MAEQSESRRAELIAAAQENWVAALTDLGGRNTLLYYKDRRASTLDLGAADPQAVERFLSTGSMRLTRLFHDVDVRADAIRRVQAIYRKARELTEERGLSASYLGIGLARWDELFLEPSAPVLLRGLTITPTRARHDDFDLALDDTAEVNPVLLHKLAAVFGADTEGLAEDPPQSAQLYERLCDLAKAADVPGFDIADRRVIGTFTYAKLPMVRDLQNAGEVLTDSDVVAAIAGDPEAQAVVSAGDDRDPILDSIPPEDDYSVLDADSSQRSAINAVLRGRSLVIHGPPGTGKSQTIANLIVTLVARGRKVLFVAEKRAAIDAVLTRLKGVDLGDMVLDIHDGTRDRLRIAQDLGSVLDRARQIPPPDVRDLHRRLVDRRGRLTQHVTALHEIHQPWGVTAFQVQSALLGIPGPARTAVRFGDLERISGDVAERLRDELREYAHLGGFELTPDATPWYGAAIETPERARQALEIVARLHASELPAARERLALASAQTGLRPPGDQAEWAGRIRLYTGILATWQKLAPEVYAAQPDLLAASADPQGKADQKADGPAMRGRERRALRKQARSLWISGRPSPEELHQALASAAGQLAAWQALSLDGGPPRVPDGLADVAALVAECDEQVEKLRTLARVPADSEPWIAALSADRDTPWRLPRLSELRADFEAMGLRPLLDEIAGKDLTADLALHAFDHAWYTSMLDHIRVRDPRYAAYRGDALDEIAGDFRQHDVEHLAANRGRARRAVAERLRDAQDHHPLQARVIRKQAALRRRHMPLRRLLDQASDVLFALKPCWAMSPLMASQVLPASRLFDVVIFDEASQITPADAIPSIMRAHQVVVAGDDRQLPPTNFFRQVSDTDDDPDSDDQPEDEEGLVSFGSGFESILDTLRPLLPTSPLTWHYRSRDERLVAFSNARIYGGALTTFPGVIRDDCLSHVVVAQDRGGGQETSVTSEVREVVELILEHARTRPSESLGVISLGLRHAERIDEALRLALTDHPDLEGFFAEDRGEPFFVKNLERVQGDERDAIFLSIAYAKHTDGRMRYHWGPLLRNGGERRLNVAATRAKRRLTLVSSFSSRDVDPDRVRRAGARMLRDYLEYAESGGTVAERPAEGDAELDPFEADVRDRLVECGITIVPQYGVGGYRVDFAAAHPQDPGRMVLAIEADGASYHSSRSARDRDRLRKEHLERLGWAFHRIWSTNWFHDPDSEIAKLQAAYEQAVATTGPPPTDDAVDDAADDAADDAEAAAAPPATAEAASGPPATAGAEVAPGPPATTQTGSPVTPLPPVRPLGRASRPIAAIDPPRLPRRQSD